MSNNLNLMTIKQASQWEGDLLGCFERAGIEMRSEIDAYFSKFK